MGWWRRATEAARWPWRAARRRGSPGWSGSSLPGEPAGDHLLPAAQADLLRRLGRTDEARAANGRALALVPHATERRFLERRRREPD